ncbi:DUF445 domain-containing protein [Archaeoglobus veneficus]|uniref:DUF445 family protein n=1 Tax=Archaeoglobus veneficus (strain DSM 11195 / SNP6) TaxID=693661 RepID=F2KNQ0_ARCVS|nr:DUF445 family protein [Archaeoglobus veneficus]AEA46278.1 protein of unknown function DUF445 [Archaeoglobus veneficus SNP6]
MELVYFLPPILGAFIGYITNVIAVELLFHPKKPVSIFGFKIQGLVPARSREIVERMMDSLSEILTQDDFEFMIDRAIVRAYIESDLAKRIDEIFDKYPLSFIRDIAERSGLVARMSLAISDSIAGVLKDAVAKNIAKNIDLREFVIKKAQEVSDEEIEKIFKKFAKKELRFIELSGAVLGFVIGCMQSLVIYPYLT